MTNVTLGEGVELMSCSIDLKSGDTTSLERATARSTGNMGGGAMSFMYISCKTDCVVCIRGYGYSNLSYSYDGTLLAIEL